MADEGQELRRVNWREVFGFTTIFNSFKLSRQLTKLAIALLAVLLTWGAASVLDLIYTPFSGIHYQVAGGDVVSEPDAHWCVGDFDGWRKGAQTSIKDWLKINAPRALKDKEGYKSEDDVRKAADEKPMTVLAQYAEVRESAYDEDIKKAKEVSDAKQRLAALQQTNAGRMAELVQLEQMERQGPFATFVNYEGHYFREAVDAVLHADIFTGFNTLANVRRNAGAGGPQQVTFAGRLTAGAGQDPLGLLACLALMVEGVLWLCCAHWGYAIPFVLIFVAIWSLAGGAIARAAALQATREEKAGIGECLRFALRRWGSFIAAPLAPVVFILVLGLLTAVIVSALGAIPGFGGIWIGLTFLMALLVAFVIAMGLTLLLGGLVLMWPTVAVEGSDFFDAWSRSFEFVLRRPWRAGLYGLVAAAYGTICYLFARFILFLTLLSAHGIVGVFTAWTDGSKVRAGATKWDLMWAGPRFEDFHNGGVTPVGLEGFNGGDWFGGWIVWCWVALVAALLTAWVVSYLLSAGTQVYLLLRRAEDATEMDEVYVEEPAEEPEQAEAAAPEDAASAPSDAPPADDEPKAE